MAGIEKWEDIIKEKRMGTPFKQFMKEIASWYPLVLYKSDGLISRYPDSNRLKGIIKTMDFEEEREQYVKYGIDYDFSKNFFKNIEILQKDISLPSLITYGGTENCDYADITHNTKNSYLTFNTTWDNENIFYSCFIKDNCKNIFNSIQVWDNSEIVYFSLAVIKSYKIFYSRYIMDSNNIWMSSNLIGCSECILCDGLVNKSYCINNQEYEKETYFEKKKAHLVNKSGFIDSYRNGSNKGKNFGSNNIESGSFVINSEDIENAYLVYQVKQGRNLIATGSNKGNENMYDCFSGGSHVSSNYYGTCSVGTSQNIYIGESIGYGSSIYYSRNLHSCSFCLGCIGLKNKSYCILNKQYTKEEWEVLADKIFAQMDAEGILGDFFPGELNPFYFNDTAACLIDDTFTKEEVMKDEYMWRDEEIKVDIPVGSEIIETKDLNLFQGYDTEGNWQINPEILKKVIKDENGNHYRIVKMEYDFLVKHNLPLPEIHWLDRIKMGFRM